MTFPWRSHVIATGTTVPPGRTGGGDVALGVVLADRLHRPVHEEEDTVEWAGGLVGAEEPGPEARVAVADNRPDETPRAASSGDLAAPAARYSERAADLRIGRAEDRRRGPPSRKPAPTKSSSSAVKGTKSFDSSEMPPTAMRGVRFDIPPMYLASYRSRWLRISPIQR